jgi:hypothetical protein
LKVSTEVLDLFSLIFVVGGTAKSTTSQPVHIDFLKGLLKVLVGGGAIFIIMLKLQAQVLWA